jgi:glutamate--cysteine ligase
MTPSLAVAVDSRPAVVAGRWSDAVAQATARAFAPHRDPGHRVGLEIELIPDQSAYEFSGGIPEDASISVEPGGQVELSLSPRPTAERAVTDAVRAVKGMRAVAAEQGVALQLVGVDPLREWFDVPLRTPSPRYLEMQELFDAVGQDGRRMMRTTAALQICIDVHPGSVGREQWLVANLIGPALSVAFANSPAGRSRTAIWRGVDVRRTGYDGRHVDATDPVGAYAAFAVAAPRFRIPNAANPAYHLSTLFPPVRPRGGYLELRFLDAQPLDRLGRVVETVAALVYDPIARREALELLRGHLVDLDATWHAAAAGQSADIDDLLAIAAAGAARLRTSELGSAR